jgi:hypothetical protein
MVEENSVSSNISVPSNLVSGFAGYQDEALLWLHHNTGSTIDGYAALDQRERNMAQQFGMSLWRLVVPALEREMSARGMAFVPMDSKLPTAPNS